MTNSPLSSRRPDVSEAAAAHTLIDDLLIEQQELTAVETFSRTRDTQEIRQRLYRDLLPATPPAPGQQYAFEVDLDKCTGCKACVSACHSLNGLDDNETWRSVGVLVSASGTTYPASKAPRARAGFQRPDFGFQQHVTTACHHCVDPACLNGCPVLAYDKDPLTGIVRHLDDQCIGCQYCVMMCPYEVPQYSKTRGIVRKCDMCHSRLAAGEAPACVQACPTSAIKISVVEQAKVRGKYRALPDLNFNGRRGNAKGRKGECSSGPPLRLAAANPFLPASPNPAITLPATRFVTSRTLPEKLFAGDHAAICRSDSHVPLVILLVLSQLAAGASVAAVFIQPAFPLLLSALIASGSALLAGSLHLGQPLKAWRSFLGWRKSWFSREVIAMSAFVFLSLIAVLSAKWPGTVEKCFVSIAALAGLAMVACSAMIYADTRRDFWSARESFAKFFGTALLLGAAETMITRSFTSASQIALTVSVAVLAIATVVKLAFERRIFSHLVDDEMPAQTPSNKTARLLAGELNIWVRMRVACAVIGGVLLPFILSLQTLAGGAVVPTLAVSALTLCVLGELTERYLFFTAVVTQKMPGGLAA